MLAQGLVKELTDFHTEYNAERLQEGRQVQSIYESELYNPRQGDWVVVDECGTWGVQGFGDWDGKQRLQFLNLDRFFMFMDFVTGKGVPYPWACRDGGS